MTNEQAIATLNHIIEVANKSDCGVKEIDGIDEDAIRMGIEALEKVEKLEKIAEELASENDWLKCIIENIQKLIDFCKNSNNDRETESVVIRFVCPICLAAILVSGLYATFMP